MIVALHVCIALASMIYTSFVYGAPSAKRLQVSYALVAATLASGTYLVWATPSHMLQTCMTGLFYIGAVFFGIIAAQRKLSSKSL